MTQISIKNSDYFHFLTHVSLFLGARSNSQRLRADTDNLQTQCANDMWSAWNNSNTSLQQRVTESTEAHNKLQSHHSKTMQEIYDQASTGWSMADCIIFDFTITKNLPALLKISKKKQRFISELVKIY